MLSSIKNWLSKHLLKEKSAHKIAASVCVGTFIAISPTIPLQTPLAMAICWVCRLNIPVAVTVLYVVNNPFTLIPIYAVGYALGVWFFNSLIKIDMEPYNPWWVERFNEYISKYIDMKKYLGSDFCFWCLIIGGFLFATMVSLILYPILTKVLTRLMAQHDIKRTGQ